jgi:hypothetical protein
LGKETLLESPCHMLVPLEVPVEREGRVAVECTAVSSAEGRSLVSFVLRSKE